MHKKITLIFFTILVLFFGIIPAQAENNTASDSEERHRIETEYGTVYLTIENISILEGEFWQSSAAEKSDETIIIGIHGIVENESSCFYEDDYLPSFIIAENIDVKDQDGFSLEYYNISGGSDGNYELNPDVKIKSKKRASYTYYANKDLTSVTVFFKNGESVSYSFNEEGAQLAHSAEDSSALVQSESSGIESIQDLSLLTDDDLETLRLQIVAEQRSRIKTKIEITPDNPVLNLGNSLKLSATIVDLSEGTKAGKFEWHSAKSDIASVNNGTIKAVGAGSTIVTCSAVLSDGLEISTDILVTVTLPIKSLSFRNKKVSVALDQQYSQPAIISPENATNTLLEYSSSDEKIASVDENGNVTAHEPGQVRISALSTDGSNKKAEYTLTVLGEKDVRNLKGKSITDESSIKSLVKSCPYQFKKMNTVDYYSSFTSYRKDFPNYDAIHTWKIFISGTYTLFCGESQMYLVQYPQKSNAKIVLQLLKWHRDILYQIPSIISSAEKNSIYIIAERDAPASSAYSKYANSSGVVNLTDSGSYDNVLSTLDSDISSMELVNAFSELGK